MKRNKLILFGVALLIVLFFGYKLRVEKYNTVPFPGESIDEYSNSWVGLSLIRLGYPVGESGLKGYPVTDDRYINVDRIYQGTAMGNTMPIDHPWFDHPPMMGLITGGFSYLKGARVFEDTIASSIRKPVIIMSVLTIGLMAFLANIVFGWKTALVSSLLMATSPLMVINSRMVQAENGFTPLFLLSLICLWFYKQKSRRWLLVASAVLSGLAVLFKLSGIALIVSGLLILLTDKRKQLKTKIQESLIFLLISGSLAFLFVVFGAALDLNIFINVLISNSGRQYGIGMNSISELISNTKITGAKFLSDGWPMVGWLGLFLLIARKKKLLKNVFVWMPTLIYLIIYIFFGSESYGWYRIPFMPFLFIIASWLVVRFSNNIRETFLSVLSLLIPIGINITRYNEINPVPWAVNMWRVMTLVTIGFATVLALLHKPNRYWRVATYVMMFGLLAIAIYTNILRTNMFTIDYWYKTY